MKLILVRHAEAVDAEAYPGKDMERPLTSAGRSVARKVGRYIQKLFPQVDVVLSSEARRAIETADLLALAWSGVVRRITPYLNPGCSLRDLRRAVKDWSDDATVVMVGHEPDLSRALAEIVADGRLRVAIKKAAWVVVEVNRQLKGELQALVPPGLAGAR